PEATLDLLRTAAVHGKPVLVEKPVATSSDLLAPYRSVWPNVIVGYNRRFYAAVAAAKAFIDRQDSCMVHMQLPDSVPPPGTGADREHNVRSNSVHGFDLLRHLVGDVAVKHI